MTSEQKIAANRENSRKSRGPRTTRGKWRASHNALRHGLASIVLRNSSVSTEIDRLAKAICGNGVTPLKYEQSVAISESEVLLLRVRAIRMAAIDSIKSTTGSLHGDMSNNPSGRVGELDAFQRALTQLEKLDRYERRALSRRKRAVRRFMELELEARDRDHDVIEPVAAGRSN